MKNALIFGASSGIGNALAHVLSANGYRVGLIARRLPLLVEMQQQIGNETVVKQLDVTDTNQIPVIFNECLQELGDLDLIIYSSGIGFINPSLDWEKEKQTVDVNVIGFTSVVNVAMQYFLSKGSGHVVNISSIAAIRGNGGAPAYGASKSYQTNYLQGLRQKVCKQRLSISITDIQPGFVDTAMAQGPGLFWVASPEKAAKQIFSAIQKKRSHAYITRRWRLIAWLLKILPDCIYNRL